MAAEVGQPSGSARIGAASAPPRRLVTQLLGAFPSGSRVLKNFLALLGADALSKCVTIFTLGYLTRTIDHDTFGRIAFAESLLLTALLVSDVGFEWYGVREIARAPGTVRTVVTTLCSLRCAVFLCTISAFALLPLFLQPTDVRTITWLFGLSLLPNALLLEWVFCGLERMGIVAVERLVRSGVYSIFVVALIHGNASAPVVPLIYFVATSAGTALLLVVYVHSFGWPKVRWQPRAWRTVLGKSTPFASNVLLLRGFYSVSMLVLGLYQSESAVAVFSAAYRPILVLGPVGGYLMTAVFPPLMRSGSEPSAGLPKHSRRLVTIVLVCAAPVLAASFTYAEDVMRTLFGAEYTTGGHSFRILGASVFLAWLGMAYATLLMAIDRTRRFSVRPGTPGARQQSPRTIRSTGTPACEAAERSAQISGSSSWFIFATIRAGRPARWCSISRSISRSKLARICTGATSSDWKNGVRARPVR